MCTMSNFATLTLPAAVVTAVAAGARLVVRGHDEQLGRSGLLWRHAGRAQSEHHRADALGPVGRVARRADRLRRRQCERPRWDGSGRRHFLQAVSQASYGGADAGVRARA